jgi:hypothetical protein
VLGQDLVADLDAAGTVGWAVEPDEPDHPFGRAAQRDDPEQPRLRLGHRPEVVQADPQQALGSPPEIAREHAPEPLAGPDLVAGKDPLQVRGVDG